MLSPPHETPWRDIPAAARTITSIMSTTNPIISYVYDSPILLTSVPRGKRELMSVWLYQLHSSEYVLSIDDGNKKCVGAAVWTGPKRKERRWWMKFGDWLKLVGLDIWMLGANVWYHGAGMNGKVLRVCCPCTDRRGRRRMRRRPMKSKRKYSGM